MTTTYTPDELLRRGIVSATNGAGLPNMEQRITDHLVGNCDPYTVAAALAKAFTELAKPGRVGRLDELSAELAEAMFDDAHEGCDSEEGCTGGGRPYYDEFVKDVLLPVLERYGVPEGPPEIVCGPEECRSAPTGGCCVDLFDAEAAAR